MENHVYLADESPQMIEAMNKARHTFKYFWREVWWERRRIVPALSLACVKVIFCQEQPSGEPLVEHMWISDIEFDGIHVKGYLINSPDYITNVKEGDLIEISLNEISDWLFAIKKIAYGGFTVQVLRGEMDKKEQNRHDKASGLKWGKPDSIKLVYEQDKHPENLIEHPLSKIMETSLVEFLTQHPDELDQKDEFGYTMLHRETVAGNRICVEILRQMGADMTAKTNSGHTASDLAEIMEWEHLIPVLHRL